MLKVVLMDDEILALNLLEAILNEIGGVEVVGIFENPIEGLEQMVSLNPDVVFLDIEMSGLNGIKLAEKFERLLIKPDIIFVTAYDQYALDAFNVHAIDYILKPIEKQRLKKTVERISNRINPPLKGYSLETSRITAKLLGSFQLIDSQKGRINWRTKKAKELAAYLIHHDEPINRHKIMEDLWPDTHIEKASTLVHSTVYQLRKRFRDCGIEDPITYKAEEYALTFAIDSDIKQLQFYLNQGEVKKILDVYSNDYLSQEDYVWSQQESNRIRKQVINFLEQYVFRIEGISMDLYKQVLDKLYEIEPWDERYTMKLVEFYVKQRNSKEATNTIVRYKDRLQKELGIKPSKEFMEVMRSMHS